MLPQGMRVTEFIENIGILGSDLGDDHSCAHEIVCDVLDNDPRLVVPFSNAVGVRREDDPGTPLVPVPFALLLRTTPVLGRWGLLSGMAATGCVSRSSRAAVRVQG